MKKILLITLFLLSTTQAATLQIQDPCSKDLLYSFQEESTLGKSVGEVSVEFFDSNAIEYQGTKEGMNSILATPTGMDAIEVISDTEMKAYGWCYKINGFEPAEFPHKVFIESEKDTIYWFFGYAHYKEGHWISQCTPSHFAPPQFYCN